MAAALQLWALEVQESLTTQRPKTSAECVDRTKTNHNTHKTNNTNTNKATRLDQHRSKNRERGETYLSSYLVCMRVEEAFALELGLEYPSVLLPIKFCCLLLFFELCRMFVECFVEVVVDTNKIVLQVL